MRLELVQYESIYPRPFDSRKLELAILLDPKNFEVLEAPIFESFDGLLAECRVTHPSRGIMLGGAEFKTHAGHGREAHTHDKSIYPAVVPQPHISLDLLGLGLIYFTCTCHGRISTNRSILETLVSLWSIGTNCFRRESAHRILPSSCNLASRRNSWLPWHLYPNMLSSKIMTTHDVLPLPDGALLPRITSESWLVLSSNVHYGFRKLKRSALQSESILYLRELVVPARKTKKLMCNEGENGRMLIQLLPVV
ncbi:hypothetical protein EDB19DRAFT_1126117 [Suillus lakei]|nr:hypothetical protein EDB19DRAFT_1126117 [Suillus lakei]